MAAQAASLLQQLLVLVMADSSSSATATASESGSRGRSAFQWGASISALLLLVLNQTGRRSSLQASLLVLSLVISLPSVLFKILREQFGYWVAFLAVVANLAFPQIFPVSRFLLFVVVPDWLAYELRESIAGGVFCLVFGIMIVVTEIHAVGGCGNCQCSLHGVGYWFSMAILLFFIILYLCLGPW
ncbi:hypothetical protein Dimus_017065 [Dionaea muscipula]